jgi:hypothetical protein
MCVLILVESLLALEMIGAECFHEVNSQTRPRLRAAGNADLPRTPRNEMCDRIHGVKIVHLWVQRIPLILPLLLRLSKKRILGRMVQIKNSITA